jgi:hypothetical protein
VGSTGAVPHLRAPPIDRRRSRGARLLLYENLNAGLEGAQRVEAGASTPRASMKTKKATLAEIGAVGEMVEAVSTGTRSDAYWWAECRGDCTVKMARLADPTIARQSKSTG